QAQEQEVSFTHAKAKHDTMPPNMEPPDRPCLAVRQPCLALASGARGALQQSPILRGEAFSTPNASPGKQNTNAKSVTHVPGSKCYLCSRSYMTGTPNPGLRFATPWANLDCPD